MSSIISFFQKLIKGGVGIRAGGGLGNFSKIDKREGDYSVLKSRLVQLVMFCKSNDTGEQGARKRRRK